MAEPPSKADLIAAAGISPSYAHMILSGDRSPSRPLAIFLFRRLGWRHSLIADLGDEDMATLERIEPYVRRTEAQEQAA